MMRGQQFSFCHFVPHTRHGRVKPDHDDEEVTTAIMRTAGGRGKNWLRAMLNLERTGKPAR